MDGKSTKDSSWMTFLDHSGYWIKVKIFYSRFYNYIFGLVFNVSYTDVTKMDESMNGHTD